MNNVDSHDRLQLVVGKGRRLALAAIVAAICSVSVAAVLTPSSGVLSAPVLARASFADLTDLKFKVKGQSQEIINVNNAQETVMQQIVIGPGGNTGWHSHPGPDSCADKVWSNVLL